MAVTATQTEIVNAALARLGSTRRVSSISEQPDAAVMWDSMVRLLLASHPWNFALRRASLNAGPTPSGTGYANFFSLPADCLRWLPPHAEHDNGYFEAVQEGDGLLTDAGAPLTIRYISDKAASDVSRWPAHFVEAVTLELAARIAEPVTQSQSKEGTFIELARDALRAAKRADGLASNGPARGQPVLRSIWLQSRNNPYVGPWSGRAPGR